MIGNSRLRVTSRRGGPSARRCKKACSCCGRTDTGVHARNFIAHFDSEKDKLHIEKNLVFKLNSFIPKEIFIHNISKMQPEAHCRFDATSRTYKYYISKKKDPFLDNTR